MADGFRDRLIGYVGLIGFGVEGDEDDGGLGLQVVDNSITAAFPFFNITVFEANFENGEIESLNAIAGGLSCLKGPK